MVCRFVFLGDRYFQYNPEGTSVYNSIIDSGSISTKFPTGTHRLPNSPDSVYFDYNTKTTYWFKGQYVSMI